VTTACRGALILLVAVGGIGCHRFQAKTPVAVVALDVPPPPARLLIPVELPAAEPELPAATELPALPAPPARPREAASRTPSTPAAPASSAPAAEPTPAPVLQTTAQVGQLEQRIQVLIAAAEQSLHNVNYRDLSPSAREQYDTANSYIRRAKDSVRARNLMYAEQLAKSAADLARLLQKG
jgi:hypothetical protein